MLLYGNGGHAKVIKDCLKTLQISFSGSFDDNSSDLYDSEKLPEIPLIISIGNNETRKQIATKVTHPFGTVIHPSAWVSETAEIEKGTVIFHQAVVQADTLVGKHCILNTSSIVEHDCQIADFVHVAPNATVCGGVSIGEGTLVGASATILPNLTIGKWAVIGAGVVIRTNVADFEKISP